MSNCVLFRSSNNIEKDNYKIIFMLIIFFIYKIFITGIYPFINGNGNLYLIFKPILFYIIYSVIEFICYKLFDKNNKIDNYFIISSLIISYILPSNTPLYIFIIGSIIGCIICYSTNNKINSVVISSLFIFYYLSFDNILIISKYNNVFNIIYIVLCIVSFVYLLCNKIVKSNILISSIIGIIILYFINNNILFYNAIFCSLFILSDNRYTPVKEYGGIFIGIIYGVLLHIFKFEYSLFLILFICEVLSIIINYLSVRFCIKYVK